jgi:hypothetical protein
MIKYHSWYILDENQNPIPAKSFDEWLTWMEDSNKRIIEETEGDNLRLVTFFLGINHSTYSDPEPILFETMIYKDYQYKKTSKILCRYHTLAEAKKGHAEYVKKYFTHVKN